MQRSLRLAAALVLAAAAAHAATLHVPGDYALIDAAVQAAQPGDVVEVAAGTYTDCTHPTEGPDTTPACVIMKSGVTLRGAGPTQTIIDAQGLGRGIFVEGVTDCRIEHLQVANAFAAAYGAGILLRQVGLDVVVTGVRVVGCTDGGVICYDHASPTLDTVFCLDNSAKQGGGLAIEEYSSPRVLNCTVSGNSAPSGAGVFIRNGSDPYITGTVVSGNTIDAPYGQGAGLFIGDSSPVLEHCVIEDNVSLGNGGGVAYQLGSGGVMRACDIRGNELAQDYVYGAGIAVDSSDPLIEGCLIVGNTCTGAYSDGAGVHTLFSPSPTLRNCTVVANGTSAGGTCGGVMAQWSSAPSLESCIIAFATAGAGVWCDSATPTVACCDVYGNAGGDALCGADGGGNFAADPLFCDTVFYKLGVGSPCADGCDGGIVGAPRGACGVSAIDETPVSARLLGNHPNPFNPTTTIAFSLDAPGAARLRITDAAGRTVATYDLGDLPAGRHETTWNGRDDDGRPVASGVYVCELQALGTQHSRRMILVK